MKVRLAVYGGLLAIVCVFVIAYRLHDGGGQAEDVARWRLWSAEAEELRVLARIAGGLSNGSNEPPRREPFQPWDRWPEKLRTSGLMRNLVAGDTRRGDDLAVTVFTKPDDPEVLLFYVVPETAGGVRPWFAVVAMDSDFLVYVRYPKETDPIVEKRDRCRAPMEVIKRICGRRE